MMTGKRKSSYELISNSIFYRCMDCEVRTPFLKCIKRTISKWHITGISKLSHFFMKICIDDDFFCNFATVTKTLH